ncbi:MAG TPA: ATP-binding cassette domain-containing protein [Nocardioidaceae bacterium]|nr:ATP-binding cassette domain-containing protein [Nocardioidaceae bacterium]
MMQEGIRVDVVGLTKMFGGFKAVDDLTFSVQPGVVTGFLGPNGAGKTTTLRCLLGLVAPTAGTATIGGMAYRDLADPIGTVGAALEASSFHPGRSARAHLEVMALGAGLDPSRAGEMLAQVGLLEVADKRVGGFSLGMRQRLGLAAALLGEPRVLILDEPANGLDPAGIVWLRSFLRTLAGEGRTVLVSSHVLGEVQQTVEDVVVLSRGRLIRQGKLADLDSGPRGVLVRTPEPEKLRDALGSTAMSAEGETEAGQVRVVGGTAEQVGHAAYVHGIELHELVAEPSDLEKAFLQMTEAGQDTAVAGNGEVQAP